MGYQESQVMIPNHDSQQLCGYLRAGFHQSLSFLIYSLRIFDYLQGPSSSRICYSVSSPDYHDIAPSILSPTPVSKLKIAR